MINVNLVKKFEFKSRKYFFIFLKSENNFFIKQNSSGSFLDIKLFYKGISVRIWILVRMYKIILLIKNLIKKSLGYLITKGRNSNILISNFDFLLRGGEYFRNWRAMINQTALSTKLLKRISTRAQVHIYIRSTSYTKSMMLSQKFFHFIISRLWYINIIKN
jgi:hypothetical protein